MQAPKTKAQELQPEVELATTGQQSPQEAKEAEKAERRKLYPVPPDAAANFRPAVGRELVEHAMQASAAKRAKAGHAVQVKECQNQETKAAGGQQSERTTSSGQDGRSSFDVRNALTKQPAAQESRTSNPATSLQLGSSREALRSPHTETHNKGAPTEKPAERRASAPALEKATDPAGEAQSATDSQGKPLRRVDPVFEAQSTDKLALDKAQTQSAGSDSTAAAGELRQAVAEDANVQESGEKRRDSSDSSGTPAIPTPVHRRDAALKVLCKSLAC